MALNNVPLTGQSLSVTKVPINSNFSTITNAFAVDHVDMVPPGTASPQGFHNKVTLPVQAMSPGPAFGANNGIYALNYTTSGITETFWHNQSASGAFDFPVTASIFSTTAVPKTINDNGGQGWCYLPSGFIMKWGTISCGIVTPGNIVFPTGANIPAFTTAVVSFSLSMGSSTGVAVANIIWYGMSNLGFSYRTTGTDNNSRFSYFAIGY